MQYTLILISTKSQTSIPIAPKSRTKYFRYLSTLRLQKLNSILLLSKLVEQSQKDAPDKIFRSKFLFLVVICAFDKTRNNQSKSWLGPIICKSN